VPIYQYEQFEALAGIHAYTSRLGNILRHMERKKIRRKSEADKG